MTSKKTATIDAQSTGVTLINVYEVEPEKQAELASRLSEATEKVMRHQPGFVSVNIHCSFDGTRVANYAQWASKEDFDRMLKSPEAQGQMKQFAAIGCWDRSRTRRTWSKRRSCAGLTPIVARSACRRRSCAASSRDFAWTT